MKNQGISLIALIITIIVIIILAAIVIFSGLNTPENAQFSAFVNDCDTVYTAILGKYADLKVEHAVSGDYRTAEQIYIEIATGTDPDQYGIMDDSDTVNKGSSATGIDYDSSNKCQHILVTGNKLDVKLPKVRQTNIAWYVTKDGRVFNATGFELNGKTYFNGSYYAEGVLPALPEDTQQARATAIAAVMMDADAGLEVDLD